MTPGELAEHFAVSKPTLSAHLAVLREADLVDSEKRGKNVTYRLKVSVLEETLLAFANTVGIGLERTAPLRPARVKPR
jgi:DNA-binding transcriptional ArsR family regulator